MDPILRFHPLKIIFKCAKNSTTDTKRVPSFQIFLSQLAAYL